MGTAGPDRLGRLFITTYLPVLLALAAAAAQSAKQQHAHLSLISEHTSVIPGQPDWIGLRFDLDPGWHIYWTNPGDSGEPAKVAWQLPAGFQAGDLQFPAPKRIPDHGLMDYGYEGSVVLLSKLTAPSSTSARQAQIGADVKYLVCREICVPGKDHLELTLPVAQGTGSNANTAQIESTKSHLPRRLPQRAKVSARSDGDSIVLVVTRKGALGTITDFIPADEQVIENAALPKIDQRGTETLITLKKSEQLVHPISRLRGLLICGEQAYNIAVPVTSNQQPSSKSTK